MRQERGGREEEVINEKKKRMKGWINAQGGEKEEKTSVSVEALTQDNNASSWQTETPRQRVLNVTRPPFHHRGSIQFFKSGNLQYNNVLLQVKVLHWRTADNFYPIVFSSGVIIAAKRFKDWCIVYCFPQSSSSYQQSQCGLKFDRHKSLNFEPQEVLLTSLILNPVRMTLGHR